MALASMRAARPADAALCLARALEEDGEWQVPLTLTLAVTLTLTLTLIVTLTLTLTLS